MIATWSTGNNAARNAVNRVSGARGFSLIELLVVFALIGLSLSVIGPRVGRSLDASRLQASVRALSATARQARSLARTEQREVTLTIDVLARTYWLDDRRKHPIRPISTKISVTGAGSERLSENQLGIRFFADGSATGGQIELSLANQLFSIEVDWLTGRARIQP